MDAIGWLVDLFLGANAFIAAVVCVRYGAERLRADWSFHRQGIVVPGAIDNIYSKETEVFSVYCFRDTAGDVHVVRTPGADVLERKARVRICYVPGAAGLAVERTRLVRRLVGGIAGVFLGLAGVAALASLLLAFVSR